MASSSLAVFEETQHVVSDDLTLTLKAATSPRVPLGPYAAVGRIPLLANIRKLLRIDLSSLEVFPEDHLPAAKQLPIVFLTAVLTFYRELAAKLDRLLHMSNPLQRQRIRKLVGSPQEIESVLEALEDTIEDLEIAISPEVHVAIERLIDEANAP